MEEARSFGHFQCGRTNQCAVGINLVRVLGSNGSRGVIGAIGKQRLEISGIHVIPSSKTRRGCSKVSVFLKMKWNKLWDIVYARQHFDISMVVQFVGIVWEGWQFVERQVYYIGRECTYFNEIF